MSKTKMNNTTDDVILTRTIKFFIPNPLKSKSNATPIT